MAMKFTQIPEDTFEQLQLGAGILVDEFTPSTGTVGNLLGATTGGMTFNPNISYEDFGADVDNCADNTMELKKVIGYDPVLSGTMLTVTAAVAKMLCAAADIATGDSTHIVPRTELLSTDFKDVWWIGDYSDKNTGANAGFIAIHLMRALNQTGFQLKSEKQKKGQFAFEYHAHYTITDMDTVPFELYVKAGTT